jgi:hypothetical protein
MYGTQSVDPNMNPIYNIDVTHTSSGISANINFNIKPNPDGSYPSDAVKDSLFQAFLTQISQLANVTVNSATKMGGYITTITP